MVEDEKWKRRRRILSQVFTFDFIVHQMTNMIALSEKAFEKIERKYWEKNPEAKEKREV